jgi:hypothetical protein
MKTPLGLFFVRLGLGCIRTTNGYLDASVLPYKRRTGRVRPWHRAIVNALVYLGHAFIEVGYAL